MPLKITIQNIRMHHPKGVVSPTDFYYMNLANRLLTAISRSGYTTDITQEARLRVALCVTLYFEDIICDAGIWRSFVAKNQQLYGRRLPFFDTPNDYQPDEPHLEDVRLIVWDAVMTFKYESVVNPENPAIEALSHLLFNMIDQQFEQAPINEALAAYFRECNFMDDFYYMRDALKFFVFSCYLTSGRHIERYLKFEIDDAKEGTDDPQEAYYMAECVLAYEYRIGPLALLPQEWLAMTMRAVGSDAEADDVETISWRKFDVYWREAFDSSAGKDLKTAGVTLRASDGELLSVTYYNLSQHDDGIARTNDFMLAMMASYRGEWFLNGPAQWGRGKGLYDKVLAELHKKQRTGHPRYEELLRDNDDSPLFYFANVDEARKFIEQSSEKPFIGDFPADWKKGNETVLAYLSPTTRSFAVSLGAPQYVCDPRNPYYDKQKAQEGAHSLVCKAGLIPGDLLQYLIAHQMLPDACLKSVVSPEHGRQLMQQNIDFFARALLRDDYHS